MKSRFLVNYEAPEDRGAAPPEPEATPPAETEATEQPWTPSQDEFAQLQSRVEQLTGIAPTVQQMAQYLQSLQEPEDDPEDFDIGRFVQEQVQQAIAPMLPIVTSAAQKSGQERMNELLAAEEKTLGKFDHKLAERVANSFFNETGDPVQAVKEGAKFAAEYRKQEREAALKEYKDSLKRGPHGADPPVEGGGDRKIPAAKTYDEVVERWAGQTEV